MAGPIFSHAHIQQFLKIFGAPAPITEKISSSDNLNITEPSSPSPQQITRIEERLVVDQLIDASSAFGGNDRSELIRPVSYALKPETVGLPKPTAEAQARLINAGLSGLPDFDRLKSTTLNQPNSPPSFGDRREKTVSSGPRIQLSLTNRSAPEADIHDGRHDQLSETRAPERLQRVSGVNRSMALDSASRNKLAELDPLTGSNIQAPRPIAEISQLALAFGLLANADLHKRWPTAYFDPRMMDRSQIRSFLKKTEEDDEENAFEGEKLKGLRAGKLIGISGAVRRIFERLRDVKLTRGKKTAVMLAVSSYAAILDVIAQELVETFKARDDQETSTQSEPRNRI